MIVLSFSICLFLFVVIGVLSATRAKKTSGDYLLAGSSVKPWLVGLSAVATQNSGWMFIGQIGFTYAVGLHSIWLMIGWITGDLFTSFFVHKRLREQAEKRKILSFSGMLANWHGEDYKIVRIVGAILTLAFLGTYAAAQLNAGSKALHVLFGWDYSYGAIIGAIMVLLYCVAGGIRASIWTDAAQSIVMVVAIAIMMIVGINEIGGINQFITDLHNVSPDYMSILPPDSGFGPIIGVLLFALGWFFAGLGVIGQPHIMVRFMTMDDPDNLNRVRLYYYSWFTLFYGMTIAVGLCARLLIQETGSFDAELAMPTLAQQLLPEVLVGLVLAGLFAATMSTADSQVLSCTAALTHDLAPEKGESYIAKKLTTVFVTMVALAIALNGNESVFSLVLIAWSILGATFGPVLFAYTVGFKLSQALILSMMTIGGATVVLWRYFDLGDIMYEIGPGIIMSVLTLILWKLVTRGKSQTVSDAQTD